MAPQRGFREERTAALEAGSPTFGTLWPWFLFILNAWLLFGTFPMMIILALAESGSLPAWMDDLSFPWLLWVVNGSLMIFAALGMAAGVAWHSAPAVRAYQLLTAQGINVVAGLGMIPMTVVSAVQFCSADFASKHSWAMPVAIVAAAYLIFQYGLWAAVSFYSFRLRAWLLLCLEPNEEVSRTENS